jgi:hypothetical protein
MNRMGDWARRRSYKGRRQSTADHAKMAPAHKLSIFSKGDSSTESPPSPTSSEICSDDGIHLYDWGKVKGERFKRCY